MKSTRLTTLLELREKLEGRYLSPMQLLELVKANYKFLNYHHHTIEYARILDDLETATKSKSL